MPVKNWIPLGKILQPRHDIVPIRKRLYPLVPYGDEASMILIQIYFLYFYTYQVSMLEYYRPPLQRWVAENYGSILGGEL